MISTARLNRFVLWVWHSWFKDSRTVITWVLQTPLTLQRHFSLGAGPCLIYFFFCLTQIVDFLRKREDFVDLMIKHIGTSAIMDMLLRMLTCIEPQQLRQDVLSVSSRATLGLCWNGFLDHFNPCNKPANITLITFIRHGSENICSQHLVDARCLVPFTHISPNEASVLG